MAAHLEALFFVAAVFAVPFWMWLRLLAIAEEQAEEAAMRRARAEQQRRDSAAELVWRAPRF